MPLTPGTLPEWLPASPATSYSPALPSPADPPSSAAEAVEAVRAPTRNPEPADPPWDRTVDVFWEQSPEVTWDGNKQFAAFKLSLLKFLRDSGHRITSSMLEAPYFRLPDAVRFRICRHLVGRGSGRPIRLNREAAYSGLWPPEHLEALGGALARLRRYTEVSFGFRADVLTTFFTSRRFHVVWSPFVMPLTCPAAVLYMRRYAAFMQHVTLELDLTRLGLGTGSGASELGPGLRNVYPRVDEFVDAQLERKGYSTLYSLRVSVRRYYGSGGGLRDCNSEAGGKGPSVDDEHLKVLDALRCLRGIVERLRIAGCSEGCAADLIRCLWVDMPQDPSEWSKNCHRIAPSTFYPLLPGQRSCLDYGPRRGIRVTEHPATFSGLYGVEPDEEAAQQRM